MADQKQPEIRGSSSHVIVACKIALPWVEFQVCAPKTVVEQTLSGSRDITVWDKSGDIVRVRGTSYPSGTPPEGFFPRPEMINGYAITEGIPRETWKTICEQQAKAPYFVNRMIVAASNREEIAAMTKEHVNTLSGLEPIKVNKAGISDPRMPKPARKEISGLSTYERV